MAKNAKVKVLNDYFPKEVQEDILKDEPTLFHQTYIQDAIDKYVKPGDYVEWLIPVRDDIRGDTIEFKMKVSAISARNGVGTCISTGWKNIVSNKNPLTVKSSNGDSNAATGVYVEWLIPVRDDIRGDTIEFKMKVVDIKIYTGATKDQEKILLGAPWNGNNQITAEFREVFLRRNQDTVVETATLPESTV